MEQVQPQVTKKKSTFVFWLTWVLLTMLSWSIILAVNVMLGPDQDAKGLWLAGLIEGLFQWLVIRSRIRYSIWWFIATSVCTFLVGMFIIFGGNPYATLTLFIIGVGLAQVLILRHSVRRAWLWLVVRTVATGFMVLASIFPIFLVLLDSSGNPVAWAIVGLIAGAFYGAVSGFGLVLLLRAPITEQPEEKIDRPKSILTFVNLVSGALVLILLIAPFLAVGQIYSLQSQAFCSEIKVGMSRPEVNKRLSNIRTISENGMLFGTTEGGVPYPTSMKSYADVAVNFYNVTLEDWLVSIPSIGLAYDKAENLIFITSDLRSYNLNYIPVNCPWSFQMTWDTLFKD